MKLYKIRDWNRHFENNRSRVIENCRWVAIPNRHDGETFSTMMLHPDGPVIFTGWILMVQLASKCTPRGSLIRGNGEPHNVTSMSAKCRLPDVHLNTAISYLENNTDWLEVVEVASETSGGRHAGVTDTSTKEGRKEGRKEGETSGAHSFSETPNWEEWWGYCKSITLVAEWYARDKFLAAEADQWEKKKAWRKYADRCKGWWEGDGRPMQPKRNGKAAPPTHAAVTTSGNY